MTLAYQSFFEKSILQLIPERSKEYLTRGEVQIIILSVANELHSLFFKHIS